MNRKEKIAALLSVAAAGALVCVLTFAPALRAADETKSESSGSTSSAQTTSKQDPKAMHREMEAMNRALQKITRQVKDPKKIDSTLQAVQDMQMRTVTLKGMTPTGAATQPANTRPQYIAEFRKRMMQVLRTEVDLEEQITQGKIEDAQKTIKALRGDEKSGHQIYLPPDVDKE